MPFEHHSFRTAGHRIAKLSAGLAILLMIGGGWKLAPSQEIRYNQDANADKRMTLLLKDFGPRPRVAQSAAPKESAIRVNQAGDGIHVETPAAEFVLTSTGYLTAIIASKGKKLTLDEHGGQSGQV